MHQHVGHAAPAAAPPAVPPRRAPKVFGNHSNRRYADQVALRYSELDNVSKVTVDFFFGWNLK